MTPQVADEGIGPSRPCGHGFLGPARLPFSPIGLVRMGRIELPRGFPHWPLEPA